MALIKCPECGKEISDTIENCIHCGYVLKKTEEATIDDSTLIKDNTSEKTDVSTEVKKDDLEENVQKTTTETRNLISTPTESKNKGCGKVLKVIAVIIALVVFLKFCSAVLDVSESESRKASESVSKQNEISSHYAKETETILFEVELDNIFREYYNNPISAEEKYEKNPLRYNIQSPGQVVDISEHKLIIAYRTNLENEKYTLISAHFSEDQLDFVKKLKKDDHIKVTGTYKSCDETGVIYDAPTITLEYCTFEMYNGTMTLS